MNVGEMTTELYDFYAAGGAPPNSSRSRRRMAVIVAWVALAAGCFLLPTALGESSGTTTDRNVDQTSSQRVLEGG